MDAKEDIGKLLKERLGDATKAPQVDLWDKIETSLDKRDRRKRGFFILWIGTGTAAALALLLFVLFTPSEVIDANSTQQDPSLPKDVQNLELVELEKNSGENKPITAIDSLETISETTTQNELSITASEEKITPTSNNTTPSSSKKRKNKDPFMDDSVTIKTTYNYYNGTTQEFLETTDKRIIDSLLNKNKFDNDTLIELEKNDIRLGEKDSIHPKN